MFRVIVKSNMHVNLVLSQTDDLALGAVAQIEHT